ncbi:hypothetical protein NBRC116590_02870 [Pelagimonas sp. KU-00592-HH]|uniref:hypothetical protein n=1 Tax=Pelagimonas sp. KU-00592-HH TaxID=3127651 RepID=UPI0031058388
MGKTKEPKADGLIIAQPFGAQIGVFKDLDEMCEYFERVVGIKDHGFRDKRAKAMASELTDEKNTHWWAVYLPEEVDLSTIVHECSHLADMVMESHGVPLGWESTEVRAYVLQRMFEQAADLCGFEV